MTSKTSHDLNIQRTPHMTSKTSYDLSSLKTGLKWPLWPRMKLNFTHKAIKWDISSDFQPLCSSYDFPSNTEANRVKRCKTLLHGNCKMQLWVKMSSRGRECILKIVIKNPFFQGPLKWNTGCPNKFCLNSKLLKILTTKNWKKFEENKKKVL